MAFDLFANPESASLGSLGLPSYLPTPPLPNLVAEWAAIIPLVTHLASPRDDHITTGDIALQGRLAVGLFPRLGAFSAYHRLLTRGTKFLDYASSRGGSSRTTWDVSWGSVFPCANGAATTAILGFVLGKTGGKPLTMPEKFSKTETATSKGIQSKITTTGVKERSKFGLFGRKTAEGRPEKEAQPIRRTQILNVFHFHRQPRKQPLRTRLLMLHQSRWYRAIFVVVLTGTFIALGLFGAYGTAALIQCCAVSEAVAGGLPVRRPSTYLRNSETDQDAFMLLAPHSNAAEWHLLTGDRGVVDSLVNKPLFLAPGDWAARWAAAWFAAANLLQLAAMTYVAAQKGWDGVCLLALLAGHWLMQCLVPRTALVEAWLAKEHIVATARSFEFGGRWAMLGAIQAFSGTCCTRWMDDIIVPHERRDAWLRRIQGQETEHDAAASDGELVLSMAEAALASSEVLQQEFNRVRFQA